MVLFKKAYYAARTFIKDVFEKLLLAVLRKMGIKDRLSDKKEVHNILIPLMAGTGDAVIFTSCLRELGRIFPGTSITVLTNGNTHGIFDFTFPEMTFIRIRSIRSIWALKKNTYDIMISPGKTIYNYLVALLIAPGSLIGYNYSLFMDKGVSYIDSANKILRQLGYAGNPGPQLRLPVKFLEETAQLVKETGVLTGAPVIAFIVGGRWKSRTYPAEKYRVLLEMLEQGPRVDVFLLGENPGEGTAVARGHSHVFNFTGRTSLLAAAGLVCQADIIVGPDSGLLNIAIALGKRVVGIFGPVMPEARVPENYLASMLCNNKCPYQPCFNGEHEPICHLERITCMDIEPKQVLDKIYNHMEYLGSSHIKEK